MNIIKSILRDFAIFFNPKSKAGLIRIAIALVLVAVTSLFLFGQDEAVAPETAEGRGVTLERVGSFGDAGSLALVGTVEAVDQATIQSEAGGRVTAVRVKLGDYVQSGAVIATLENSSQSAAVIQAEGSYEAALASAAQSDVSVSSAQTARVAERNTAINTVRSAYNTASNVILNQIDEFFSNPESQTTPGLRLDGYGDTSYLNSERVAFQTILPEWRDDVNTLSSTDDLQASLNEAEARVERVKEMVDTFITLLNRQDSYLQYTQSELQTYSTAFVATRAQLNTLLLSIDNARTSLQTAEDTLSRAEIGGTDATVSSANAQVKQALGSLRAAQANYNKTILRSPIAGEVQTLSVGTGDFISAFTPVATVANQNALEITTFVSQNDRERIAVGDRVLIEGSIEGTVTAIAPAIDPATGKIEVKIQSESDSLQNGATVKLAIERDADSETPIVDTSAPIIIPITAIKVETNRMVVFTVSSENTLVAHEVVDGPLLGSSIVITEGVTPDMEIVTDARGLNEGDTVTVLAK